MAASCRSPACAVNREKMMKTALTLALIAAPSVVLAHAGHLAPVDGHAHGEIVAAAALALGLVLTLVARRARK